MSLTDIQISAVIFSKLQKGLFGPKSFKKKLFFASNEKMSLKRVGMVA